MPDHGSGRPWPLEGWLAARRESLGDAGLLVLRLTLGGMMLTHGWPKVGRLLEEPVRFADPLGLGPELSLGLTIFAELICALLIVGGAATRLAAVPLLITMLVAAFIVHGDDPFKKQELALLYAGGTLGLLLTGAGRYSIDALLVGRRERARRA